MSREYHERFKTVSHEPRKGIVVGQLVPVEYNRLTLSETVSIDEPAGGYMEMLEYRNSARTETWKTRVPWKVIWRR